MKIDKSVIDAFNKYKEASNELAVAILESKEVESHLAVASVLIMDKTGCLIANNIGENEDGQNEI